MRAYRHQGRVGEAGREEETYVRVEGGKAVSKGWKRGSEREKEGS